MTDLTTLPDRALSIRQPVPFIPVKGALGLFKWKRNVVAK